jgi:hypothetical protein
MRFLRRAARLLLLVIASGEHASADPVVLTFEEGLLNIEAVGSFYDGGLGALGSGPGPDLGIVFENVAVLVDTDAPTGEGDFANEPTPDSVGAVFFMQEYTLMNVLDGFTTGFSFYYSTYAPATLDVYDGPDATGNLLGSIDLLPQCCPVHGCKASGDPRGTFRCWDQAGIAFDGTAYSVDLTGAEGMIAFDNITLGSPIPIPEPDRELLLGTSLLVLGLLARRTGRLPHAGRLGAGPT